MSIHFNREAYNKVFNDLDAYLDFCRLELREYNPAHLYDKTNHNYKAFMAFKSKGKNYKPSRFFGRKKYKK